VRLLNCGGWVHRVVEAPWGTYKGGIGMCRLLFAHSRLILTQKQHVGELVRE
jgi:hypothetical protein